MGREREGLQSKANAFFVDKNIALIRWKIGGHTKSY
jgi:hypothetical protein